VGQAKKEADAKLGRGIIQRVDMAGQQQL